MGTQGTDAGDKQKAQPLVHDPFRKLSSSGVAAALVITLLMFRLFAVSGWDWQVATEIVDSFSVADALSIGLGTLFERPVITGALIVVALPLSLFRDYWLAQGTNTRARANNAFLVLGMLTVLVVLIRTFQMWWALVSAVLLTIVLVLIGYLWRKGTARPLLAQLGKHVGIFLAVAALILSAVIQTPWMARERIETPVEVIYGYVLENNPGFLKVLTDDREVIILPDVDVTSRTIVGSP